MKLIESVRIKLTDPGHPHSIEIFGKLRDEKNQLEEVDLTAMMLVQWPIDIHIDSDGAIATLKMRVSELELNDIAVKIEETAG